ncbi:MAG TPA: hypothetical protein VG454_00045 [Gemmatimonadales bacterium]|nr:hypothetical protein [Gemmatimonadales bacterium]
MIAGFALLLQLGVPRWATFHDIRLGGPIDAVLANGGECRPGDAAGQMGPGISAVMFAQMSFGDALPHDHQPRDSTAIRRALGVGTMCWAALDSAERAMVAAVDRKVVAMVVYFLRDSLPLPADSVRHVAYAAWGRPTHHSPTLDTWSNTRYRSYFLLPAVPARGYSPPAWKRAPRLILLDIAACTAFDRRAHRAGISGEAAEC